MNNPTSIISFSSPLPPIQRCVAFRSWKEALPEVGYSKRLWDLRRFLLIFSVASNLHTFALNFIYGNIKKGTALDPTSTVRAVPVITKNCLTKVTLWADAFKWCKSSHRFSAGPANYAAHSPSGASKHRVVYYKRSDQIRRIPSRQSLECWNKFLSVNSHSCENYGFSFIMIG